MPKYITSDDGTTQFEVVKSTTKTTAQLMAGAEKAYDRRDELDKLEGLTSTGAEIDEAVSIVLSDGIFSIGTAGDIGFGVGAVPKSKIPNGFIPMEGHYTVGHNNYGNLIDASGSIMVAIPKFYFKIVGNTFHISSTQESGYVLHRMFINANQELDYVLVDKYTCGNVGGIFTSQAGLDPCSTSTAHNPIGDLNNAPINNYGGLYSAAKTRGDDYFLASMFIYNGLALLAKAHGDFATAATCAFKDVLPYLPKGCNNNALADTNDASVTYASSGYSNCGLTGAITNFAKTTHNGQACGVADLNGNMYEVASGFIRFDATGFLSLKESSDITIIADDSTTQGAGGAYDINLYDGIDLTDFITDIETGSWMKPGNGTEQVFSFSTDRTSLEYKKTMLGIPNLSGSSTGGTTEFGNDGIYRYLRNEMACRVGLDWSYSSYAGVFSAHLGHGRTYSNDYVGGRASYCVALA